MGKSRLTRCSSCGRVGAAVLLLLLSPAALVVLTSSASAAAAGASSSQPSPSTDPVIADLETYIPGQLEFADVPGLAIALIREGEIAWEAGFGVANTITGDPVTADSVFEVASLSKPVAAYTALRLVDSGELELDEPVYLLFEKAWLPRSEWGDQITLRHLLAHTSGLSSRLYPLDKSLSFAPGERYEYSNVGYQYLQGVMEQVTGSPLEAVAGAAVFEPLDMSSSTYADDPGVTSGLVSGHVNYGSDLGALLATLAVCFVVVLVLGIVVQRLWKKRIAVTWRLLGICYAVGAVASLPVVAWLNGGFNKWWLLFVIIIVILSAWVAAWAFGSVVVTRRLPERWRSGGRRWMTRAASFLVCLAIFVLVANAISGPVPKRPSPAPGAAYSLKTTAGDLARFLIEVADPEHLELDTAAEMVRPQVETGDSNSEGLGIGIYHGPDHDWLWHTGANPGFVSLMVMCPATGDGVVVLTNAQSGFLVTNNVARRAMGVEFNWVSE
jgi:CubicO group peptidase (beta-lactamase class C family)